IQIAASIENYFRNTFGFGAIGNQFTDGLGAREVASAGYARALFVRGGGGHRAALAVVDHLRVNMVKAAENSQAGTFFAPSDALPNALVNARTNLVFRSSG